MNKKSIIIALSAIMLFTPITLSKSSKVNATIKASRKYSAPKYVKKFYKVRITKKTPYYKVIPGKYEALNKYKKVGYLKPGKIVYVRARGISWGWTIGKKYKYCTFKDWQDFSWFSIKLNKRKAKPRAVKNSKTINKATFKKDGPEYIYNDKDCKISIGLNGAQYIKSRSDNFLLFTLKYTNKTRKTVSSASNILSRAKFYQNNKSLTIEQFKPSENVTVKKNKSIIIKFRTKNNNVNEKDLINISFSRPFSRKIVGIASITPLSYENHSNTGSSIKKPIETTKNSQVNSNSSDNVVVKHNNIENSFNGFPINASLLEKWNIVKSLSGKAREDAEYELMNEMGLTTSQVGGNYKIAPEAFEKQMDKINRNSKSMYNLITGNN